MKYQLLISFVLVSLLANAQEIPQDSTLAEQDTLEVSEPEKKAHIGIYVEVSLEGVQGLRKRNFCQQFGLGFEYNRLNMGIYQNLALGHTSRQLIFPNNFDLIYTYGGVHVGLKVLQSRYLETDIRFNYGHGDMIWEQSDDKSDFTRDTYHIFKPELVVSFVPVPFVKAFGLVGYRQFTGLKLPNIENNDFSGVTFAAGIKVGYFK